MIGAIHVYSILTPGPASVNAEGRSVATYASASVQGRVDELTARDVEIAAQVGARHDIVALADAEVVVTDRALLVVTDPPTLAGTYKVDTVRTTRSHRRLLASRVTVGR